MTMDGHESRATGRERPAPARGIWLTALLLVAAIVLCVVSVRWRGTVVLHRIVVDGLVVLPERDVVARAAVPLNTPLDNVDILEVKRRLLNEPFIRRATVNRQYPDMLRIHVVERTPVASLNCGQLLYVDTEGVLLPPVRSSARLDLPVISGIGGIQGAPMGQVCANAELAEALSVVRTAATVDSGLMHFISEINMNNGGDIDLFPADANVRIVLGRGDLGKKFVVLHAFWHNFISSTNPDQVEYIDLRFDDEVVVKRRGVPDVQANVSM